MVEAIKAKNNVKIANQYNIGEATIRRWKEKYKEELCVKETEKDNQKKKTTLKNSRKAKFSLMEKDLLDFINDQRNKKLSVGMRDIITEATKLMKIHYPNEKFSGSHGWFCRFINRANLSRRGGGYTFGEDWRGLAKFVLIHP